MFLGVFFPTMLMGWVWNPAAVEVADFTKNRTEERF
jgi:hypothetical protein